MAGISIRKGSAPRSTRPYPTTVCAVRYRDPVSGRLVASPEDKVKAATNGKRARARKARSIEDRAVVTRFKDDTGEVTSARVVMQGARAAQRRGQVKKAAVRELERDLSRDALEAFNPSRAGELGRERMAEAYRSDKAKRGAATKRKNQAAGVKKKTRPVAEVQTQLLRAEELVRDAQRRHASATTTAAKSRHAQSIKTRRARVQKLRTELTKAKA